MHFDMECTYHMLDLPLDPKYEVYVCDSRDELKQQSVSAKVQLIVKSIKTHVENKGF